MLFAFEMILRFFTPIKQITFSRLLSISCINLLASLAIRMAYRYCFKCGTADTRMGKFLRWVFHLFTGETLVATESVSRIKIAIIGAGRVGVTLAEELLSNPNALYTPPVLRGCESGKGRSCDSRYPGASGRRDHPGNPEKT